MSSSREKLSTFEFFVFLAKQNISTDWEPKNSTEKPVQLASTFSLFFSAALKLLLGFSQQLQKRTKIQMFSTPCRSVTSLGLSFFKSLRLYLFYYVLTHRMHVCSYYLLIQNWLCFIGNDIWTDFFKTVSVKCVYKSLEENKNAFEFFFIRKQYILFGFFNVDFLV